MLTKIGHGPYLTVAHNGIFLMLRRSPQAEFLESDTGIALWHALAAPNATAKVLELLAAQGLTHMPDFAMVRVSDQGLHVTVRSQCAVHTIDAEGNRNVVDAAGAITWRETLIPGPHEFAIAVNPVASLEPPFSQDTCFLASGIVTAGALYSPDWTSGNLCPDSHLTAGDVAGEPVAQAPVQAPAEKIVEVIAEPEIASVPVVESVPEPVIAAPEPVAPVVPAPTEVMGYLGQPSVPVTPVAPVAPVPLTAPAPTEVLNYLDQFDVHETSGVANNLAVPTQDAEDDSTILSNNLVEFRAGMAVNDRATEVFPVPAPAPLSVLHLSGGGQVPIDRTLLIGRAPQAARVSGTDLPRLITVNSPNNDISRTHLQVRMDGDLVLATDLNSTNGVMLTEPGQAPRRLHPDEPTPVPDGAILDIGEGIILWVVTAT